MPVLQLWGLLGLRQQTVDLAQNRALGGALYTVGQRISSGAPTENSVLVRNADVFIIDPLQTSSHRFGNISSLCAGLFDRAAFYRCALHDLTMPYRLMPT